MVHIFYSIGGLIYQPDMPTWLEVIPNHLLLSNAHEMLAVRVITQCEKSPIISTELDDLIAGAKT